MAATLVLPAASVPRRDPALPARTGWTVLALVVLWPLLVIAQFDPRVLWDAQNLQVMGNFLAGFLPPESGAEFLRLLVRATCETLAIATAGLALAFLLAVPLALLASYSLSIARLGPGRGRSGGAVVRGAARLLMLVLRAIPDIVWALVFVRVVGLGPTAGVLALAISYGGMLGKVYAEILESTDERGARALLEAGSGRLPAFLYGLLPHASRELASYTVYRWECAVRASVVMGLVGAGGLGQLMDQSIKMLNGGEAATILVMFLLLVILADVLSAWVRRLLA